MDHTFHLLNVYILYKRIINYYLKFFFCIDIITVGIKKQFYGHAVVLISWSECSVCVKNDHTKWTHLHKLYFDPIELAC